jgi:hypothetical protein
MADAQPQDDGMCVAVEDYVRPPFEIHVNAMAAGAAWDNWTMGPAAAAAGTSSINADISSFSNRPLLLLLLAVARNAGEGA